MKIVCSKKSLSITFTEKERMLYKLECCNIAHFYAARYAAIQAKCGRDLDHELLRPLKG